MRIVAISIVSTTLGLPSLGLLSGCQATNVWVREALLGQAKRDQLVSSVEAAREEQTEAKETFSSALDELLAISAGAESTRELESQYSKVERAFSASEAKAKAVRKRIDSVESIADRLFGEWTDELGEYTNEDFRRKAEVQLASTKEKYEGLIASMRRAASKMDPVLAAFKDQTLFLKHNLNAQAIASLATDLEEIRVDVSELIAEMEAAIAEADTFIASVAGG